MKGPACTTRNSLGLRPLNISRQNSRFLDVFQLAVKSYSRGGLLSRSFTEKNASIVSEQRCRPSVLRLKLQKQRLNSCCTVNFFLVDIWNDLEAECSVSQRQLEAEQVAAKRFARNEKKLLVHRRSRHAIMDSSSTVLPTWCIKALKLLFSWVVKSL